MALLFSITAFVSAALLFVVQPIVSKTLLPVLGGVPAVWNTCLVFFQSVVLLGYGYAHAAAARLRGGRQVSVHLVAASLGVGALVLPARLHAAGVFSATEQPIRWLLLQLTVAVGLPLAVLSATAPLLQHWLARLSNERGRDPYSLYAGSNLGSVVALLSYPVLIEPHLSLQSQDRLWTAGYVIFVGLIAACGVLSWSARPRECVPAAPATAVRPAAARAVDARRRLSWILLALAPSSYLMGVTTFVSTEVAVVPLLWVVPLALYLLSFILVFAPTSLVSHHRVARVLPALILFAVLVSASGMTLPLWLSIPLHLSAFFAAAITCHGELASDRPAPSALTAYYVLISLGGAAGGALTALAAPVLFDRIVEYPLAMVLTCLLRPAAADDADDAHERRAGDDRARWWDVALPVALGGLTAGLVLTMPWMNLHSEQARVAWMFGLPAIVCYTFLARRVRFALGVAAFLLAAHLYAGPQGRPLFEQRTFFGVLRVTSDPSGQFHQLVHGQTIHGRQRRGGSLRDVPLSYYHPSGPAGDVFAYFREQRGPAPVAVIGLGAGSLCAYARPGDEWVFYELDPAIERLARDPRYFTFWRDCRAERRSVVIGDARVRLASADDARYAMLIVDAFSSDVIPVHLVTREAFDLYRRKTAAGGWIVFHVSSQHLDLEPVLAGLARDAGWVAYARDDLVLTPEERHAGKDPSRWVVLTSTRPALAEHPQWHALAAADDARVWTDDFSNVWTVIRPE
ncbi:MAG TPA: fused MFS/spermidine synthase [Gaiellales bacterium]|nr:fused MFS/spermidine synthase [Gaiellales bacterium]